ncbi:MAG: transcriptional repressor [Firmicutes bacterium]|nr:transcriptional repressor [Bacillota bacterium]
MDEQTLARIREQLSDHDHRLTPQRQAILQVLVEQGNPQHMSAEKIFMEAKKLHPELGLATVYRTLEIFEKLGIVYKLEYGDGQARFEFNDNVEEHYHHHLICLGCGKIQEFNDDLLEDMERAIAQQADFDITDHCLRFFGYCSECRKSRQGERTP